MFNKYHRVEIKKRFSSIIHHVCASVLVSSWAFIDLLNNKKDSGLRGQI